MAGTFCKILDLLATREVEGLNAIFFYLLAAIKIN
jgi:hypothetical protein